MVVQRAVCFTPFSIPILFLFLFEFLLKSTHLEQSSFTCLGYMDEFGLLQQEW